jgi:two-component system response regulator AtoC
LVVEPDAGIRALLVSWLRDSRYTAEGAASFEAARRVLSRRPPDLLITDVRLGAFNGLHLVITTRASRPALRAIVITAVDDAALRAEAMEADAGYLVKPVTREALLDAAAQALTPRAAGHT